VEGLSDILKSRIVHFRAGNTRRTCDFLITKLTLITEVRRRFHSGSKSCTGFLLKTGTSDRQLFKMCGHDSVMGHD
jgi:hypothetical protein